jgi:hypothetical protein
MELFDVLIFGAVIYYIVQAVRRAATTQIEQRPPGSVTTEDGERVSERERLRRALAGAAEWEEEQRRLREDAEVRAEVEAMRSDERARQSPWRTSREEQRRRIEPAEGPSPADAAPALSDALAGVAALLEQRAAGQPSPARPPSHPRSGESRVHLARHGERAEKRLSPPGDRVARRDRERPGAVVSRRPAAAASPAPPALALPTGDARREHEVTPGSPARRGSGQALAELPGLARLTPLQRAVVYADIFGRPVGLSDSGSDTRPD